MSIKKDPRTVARDIPGVFDNIFPQLASGLIAHLNRMSYKLQSCKDIPSELVSSSSLNKAMLFEIAIVRAEQILLESEEPNWKICLEEAGKRQNCFHDTEIPDTISQIDKDIVEKTAYNLVTMIGYIKSNSNNGVLIVSPKIYGYQWINSGLGDFSIGNKLIEVKCTNKHFSSSDYRQIVMYWLLSYAASITKGGKEWKTAVLINPRLNYILEISFDDIINIAGAGKSKIEIFEIFSATVEKDAFKMLGL